MSAGDPAVEAKDRDLVIALNLESYLIRQWAAPEWVSALPYGIPAGAGIETVSLSGSHRRSRCRMADARPARLLDRMPCTDAGTAATHLPVTLPLSTQHAVGILTAREHVAVLLEHS